MSLTAAERQRKRRQLRDEGKHDSYRERQNEINTKCRDGQKSRNLKDGTSRKTVRRAVVRKRVLKCRALREATLTATSANSPLPFKSSVALGKATRRARLNSASCAAVHPKEENSRDPQAVRLLCRITCKGTIRQNTISTESVEAVKSFYQPDDIRRQAPGRKAGVTFCHLQ